jgi:hypothetical protein
MAQFFAPPDQGGNIYGNLGSLLGHLGGIGINYGISQYQLPEKIKNFEAFGATPAQAKALAQAPESQQNVWLRENMKQSQLNTKSSALANILGGKRTTPIEQPTVTEQPPTESVVPSNVDAQFKKEIIQNADLLTPDEIDKVITSGMFNINEISQIQNIITQKEKLASMTRKEKLEERKQAHIEQREIDKDTKPFYEKVINESKGAQKTDARLNRMEELVQKGNLRHPFWNSLFDTVASGIFGPHGPKMDIHFLQNADTQEFRKLSREFIKNAKDIFGSRVTEGEIKLLLESVPSLSQTDEGKMRIINNLRIFNEASKAEKEAMEEIINENNGRRPKDLELLVSKRVSPKLDYFADQLKSGVR